MARPSKIVGTLEGSDVKSGSGKKGIWYKFSYTVDGKKYYTFDAKIATAMSDIKDGELVEFSLERNDNFENIIEARKAA